MKSLFLLAGSIFLFTQISNAQSPILINATDTVGKPLPFEVNDNISSSVYGTNTFGRQIRLSRQSTYTYDIGMDASNDFFITRRSSTSVAFKIDGDGNIGIGTTTPQSKLAVNGAVTATRVRVTQTGWPDFVFQPGYELPSLSAIERFIKKHHHLPGIPSATAIKKDGLDIGQGQAMLLQKIEELTLHLIKVNKQLELQQQLITEQGEALRKLKNSSNK